MATQQMFFSKDSDIPDNKSSRAFLSLDKGTVISERYTVQELLGRGSSGSVYLCTDQVLGGLTVAVKLFPRIEQSDQKLIRRMYREMLTCNKITHPNVTKFYDCIYSKEFVGYSMEYVDGFSVAHLLEKHEQVSMPVILRIFRQLMEGLSAVHSIGVVHRDIKPSNLLITSGGGLKISDFGVATQRTKNLQIIEGLPNFQSLEEDRPIDTYTYTEEGCFVGTPRYLSPEYVEHGYADFRSDLYACGIILYELVTQCYPFRYDRLTDLLQLKVEQDPIPPSQYRKDCPIALETFIMRLIAKNPNFRHASTQDVLMDLQQLEEGKEPIESPGMTLGSYAAAIDAYRGISEGAGHSTTLEVQMVEVRTSPSFFLLTLITIMCFFGSIVSLILANHPAFEPARTQFVRLYAEALQALWNLPIVK